MKQKCVQLLLFIDAWSLFLWLALCCHMEELVVFACFLQIVFMSMRGEGKRRLQPKHSFFNKEPVITKGT